MTPTEAGFDGAKGFRIPHHGENYRIHLKRGKQPPGDFPKHDFREQLIWHNPDDAPARLLWCNADRQWFELSFTPTDA